ncbi:MAG: cryptochrome/photolyase family protein [Patescibacteria group bacterium]|jgi:deoxyribodipyrimidine photolyase-related protein|nr:cryptochrome/photolyase family protein [Patescibacteria group bacterium]
MKQTKTALIIYPNQLFAIEHLPDTDIIFVVEEPLYFGTDSQYPVSYHKQKLVLHRAAMRRYTEETLWPANLNVEYIELKDMQTTGDVLIRARNQGVETINIFDPVDFAIEHRLQETLDKFIEPPFEIKVLPNPSFMLKKGDIDEFFADKKAYKFADFYQWQRERFNILLDKKYKPIGGKWSFDTDNRQKLPADHIAPGFESFGANNFVEEAINWVEKNFPNNPGLTGGFFWPTNHQEALKWLENFIKDRLEFFGPYEDAIDGQSVLLYHSGVSAPLNCGLLTPNEVVDKVVEAYQNDNLPLNSVEGFIRQVIGWREYVRALYVLNGVELRNSNGLGQTRDLSDSWWNGTTGLPPVDDVIKKVNEHGYAHHIERLMIMGNIMLLCEIKPSQVYGWFMSLFIDAYDWVMVPNVYGMSQFSDMGSMVTKPYISGSNYILNMSHYQKDDWCDVWDGLFWGFVERHQDMLAKNPRTSMMVKNLKRLNPDKKRIIGYRAKDFLDSIN